MKEGVHDALSLILSMSLSFGAFPMRAQKETYVFSWRLYLYGILLTSAALAEGVYEIINFAMVYSVSLVMIIDCLAFCFNVCTVIIVLYLQYLLRETLPAIISELDEIDKLIGTVSYSRCQNYVLIAISSLNALHRLFVFFYRPFSWNHLITRILYYLINQIPICIAAQYAILFHILSRQLRTLSEQLNTALTNMEIWNLINVHYSLVVLGVRINRAFDIFLFQSITFSFVLNILKLYLVIVYIVKPVSYTDLELTTSSVLDIITNCAVMITLVYAAMLAAKNAELFNSQLLKQLLISKTIAKDEKIRTYLVMKHSIQQNACNFFSLDYHLLTSIAAGSTTYVILLVQFTLM